MDGFRVGGRRNNVLDLSSKFRAPEFNTPDPGQVLGECVRLELSLPTNSP